MADTRSPAPTRLLLLDTASLYFRAFFGLPSSMTAPDGRQVNAVRGLLDFTARFITDYRPTHLACCWDNDWRPSWRVDLLPSYKAHRVAPVQAATPVIGAGGAGAATGQSEEAPDELEAQVPLIVDALNALGLPIVGVDDHEADDVIGTLATTSGMPTDVVTGDRDLFQLVDDDAEVRVLYVARGINKHERVDGALLHRKYGIEPRHYVDFAVLRGDPSDGLPGVAGIGEKTASSLLTKYGSIDALVEVAQDPKGGLAPGVRSKLAAAVDYLGPAREVVQVVRDLPLPLEVDDLRLVDSPAEPDRWSELVDELGLGGSAERIVAALATAADGS
ncbi:5'-3' exonuclease [Propionibacteriaceae bacterium Y2011]|uniref:5'-3' exonuclease n=1 Tax=Microlunatus sp. Y2014 TaxID=3418488 RepID=UPI003B4A29EC